MKSKQFDALTRALSSRRSVLAGTVLALLGFTGAGDVRAHNSVAACRRIDDPRKRRRCLRRARAHNRKQHSCRPQPTAVTCSLRCGPVRNNCGRVLNCSCPADMVCQPNGTCGRICPSAGEAIGCPPGCHCAVAAVEGGTRCIPATITQCPQVPIVCVSTTDCPLGHYCSEPICEGGTSRCIPVCPS